MNKVQLLAFTIQFVIILGNLITYAIIIRILLSWFTMGQMGQKGKISQFFYDLTDPVINLAKKIPHRIGMFDLSPLIALIGIDILVAVIVALLNKLI